MDATPASSPSLFASPSSSVFAPAATGMAPPRSPRSERLVRDGNSRHRVTMLFQELFGPAGAVRVLDRKLDDQVLAACFVGNEAVDWLVSGKGLTRRAGAEWCQTFLDKGYIAAAVEPLAGSPPSASPPPGSPHGSGALPLAVASPPALAVFEDKFTFYRLTGKGRALAQGSASKLGSSDERARASNHSNPHKARSGGALGESGTPVSAASVPPAAARGASGDKLARVSGTLLPAALVAPAQEADRKALEALVGALQRGPVSPGRARKGKAPPLGAMHPSARHSVSFMTAAAERAAAAPLPPDAEPRSPHRAGGSALAAQSSKELWRKSSLLMGKEGSGPALAAGAPMQGWLHKQSHSDPARWKRRFIVLRDGATQWYRSAPEEGAGGAAGRIPMDVVSGVRMAPERHPLAFCIDVVTRSFVLRAASRDELNDWVFAYHRAAQQVLQLLTDPHHMPRATRLQLHKWWKARPIAQPHSAGGAADACHVDAAGEDGGEGVRAGAAWSAGRRPTMEDAHVMHTALREELAALPAPLADGDGALAAFAVFDGHGGRAAAEWCARELIGAACAHAAFARGDAAAALAAAFESCDATLCAQQAASGDRSGACALVALVCGALVTLAHCGDCRAVMGWVDAADDPDALCVVPLTDDHKPNAPAERGRIERAGGFVQVHTEPDMSALLRKSPAELAELQRAGAAGAAQLPTVSIARVQGTLSVARAFGDPGFKALKHELFEGGQFSGDLVTATPDTRTIELPEVASFLVLACDGLWDVLSNEKAARMVWLALKGGATPREAARRLVDKALARGTLDNVTVMVVQFEPPDR